MMELSERLGIVLFGFLPAPVCTPLVRSDRGFTGYDEMSMSGERSQDGSNLLHC